MCVIAPLVQSVKIAGANAACAGWRSSVRLRSELQQSKGLCTIFPGASKSFRRLSGETKEG
ncbi:MAG: hypothetical protein ACJARR_003179 [Pseudophaeobacter arcticus]|jgi:hypothetical protein